MHTLPIIYTDHLLLDPCKERDREALESFRGTTRLKRSRLAHLFPEQLWAIRRHRDGPPIGFCGFNRDGSDGKAEFLFELSPQCWGEGAGPEACQAALSYFWNTDDARIIYAKTARGNRKASAVLEQVGLTYRSSDGRHTSIYTIERPLR